VPVRAEILDVGDAFIIDSNKQPKHLQQQATVDMDMQIRLATIRAPYVRLAEPELALLYLGSLFETLHDAPERDDAMLDALAGQILDERPKTLLGLAIKGLRGEVASPASVDGRLRQPLAVRSGCSRRDRQCDAYRRRRSPIHNGIPSRLACAQRRWPCRRAGSARRLALTPYRAHSRPAGQNGTS
jgi:hypothetical protein